MFDRLVGPREVIYQGHVPHSATQTWQLVDRWARSMGLELLSQDGISRTYGKQRGAIAQIRQVIGAIAGQLRLDGVGPVQFTLTTSAQDGLNINKVNDEVRTDQQRNTSTMLIVRVDMSNQRETTAWTGGGIIIGGSAAFTYLANTTDFWMWLFGVPVAVGVGWSYFRERQAMIKPLYSTIEATLDAIVAGQVPPLKRDLLLRRLKTLRGLE